MKYSVSYLQTLTLCALCIVVTPLLIVGMVAQAIAGSRVRAYRMAIALDQCGNALLGGSEDETISSRVGRALLEGKSWAKPAAFLIDLAFGKNHCVESIGV